MPGALAVPPPVEDVEDVRRLVVALEPAGLAAVFRLDRLAAGFRVVLAAAAVLVAAAGLAR